MIKVALVDDNKWVLGGLRDFIGHLPGVEIISSSGNPQEAVDTFNWLEIQVLITDFRMKPMNGVELAIKAREVNPDIRVIMQSMYYKHTILRVSKSYDIIINAVIGQGHLDTDLEIKIHQVLDNPVDSNEPKTIDFPNKLTTYEENVLRDLQQGMTYEEIATNQERSINTVKTWIREIYSKLGAENRNHAIKLGINEGYLFPEEHE